MADRAEIVAPGRRIMAWRKFRGWTQVQLAERAGIGAATISRLEVDEDEDSPEVRWSTMVKLLHGLRISEARLWEPTPAEEEETADALARSQAAAGRTE